MSVSPRHDGSRRPVFVVVSHRTDPDEWVTSTARDTLTAAGEVRHLNLSGLQRDDALRAIESSAADAAALVFRPWTSYGLLDLAPGCWELLPALRVISGTFDNRFDPAVLEDVNSRGITVVDTSRTMTPQVAEFALLMILNLLRGVPDAVAGVRRGEFPVREWWAYEENFVTGDLTGLRVGLAGLGSINRRLVELLRPFRCPVASYDPYVDDETFDSLGVRRASSLTELAGGSQIFVVGIPPTPRTLRIIDRAVIDALAPGSLFVLVTRMAVVEQEPLWARLAAGEIRAAVDVYDPEPPPADAPFRAYPNLIPTPHMAGNTVQSHRRCFQVACEEAVRVVEGESTAFELTPRDAAMYAGEPLDSS
jgi:phosphoglycerate dehydrogenase-like enzyme